MPRPPSIRLRAAKLNARILERFERKLDADPLYIPDVKESQSLVNLAKADALLRDRGTTREEEEDAEMTEQDREKKARELVAKVRQSLAQNPAAEVSRSGGEPDDDT